MSPPSTQEAGMQMSERQWRVLSLLERLELGEVTVGEVAARLGRSRRQMQRMRKRVAGTGATGLVHGNSGRCPKHRTSREVREQVVMLRRGKPHRAHPRSCHRHPETARLGVRDLRGKGCRRQTPALGRLPHLLRRAMHRMGERLTTAACNGQRPKQRQTSQHGGRGSDISTEQLRGDIFTSL